MDSAKIRVVNALVRAGARKAIQALGVTIGVFLVCLSAFSQASTGRIMGAVTDQTGGAIVGATVAVTDVQRGISHNLITDQAGEYNAPNLLPSMYTIRVEFKGFKAVERSNILVEVGKELRIDLTLEPGEVTQTVVVTEAAPMVETTNATLGGTLSNATINDLPLNGRNFENLLQYRPGITIYPGGGSSTQSTNGIRPEDNVYLMEGQFISEAFGGGSIINGAGPAGDSATIMPIDAIQEFNTEENPKAEFGWKPGTIVNVGLKSGTNMLHGTAYAFGRDAAWDARNFYDTEPSPKTPLSLEQFGGTVGGPIKKDKLFFFAGYEGQRYTAGNSFSESIPEDLPQATPSPANSIPDAISGITAAGLPVSPVSLKLLGCTAPAAGSPTGTPYTCTGGLYPSNTTSSPSLITGFPNTNVSDNGLAKIDYHINDKHTLSGEFFSGFNTAAAMDFPYVNAAFLSAITIRSYMGAGNWTYVINPQWVNQALFGYNHFFDSFYPVDHTLNALTAYGINTGVSNPPTTGGLPAIYIGAFNYLGNGANHPKIIGPDSQFSFADNMSHLMGKHGIKFGGEVRDGLVTQGTYRGGRGRINFKNGNVNGTSCVTDANPLATCTALENFMAGEPKNGLLLLGNPIRHLDQWSFAGFLQDDWRIKPRVTLNLGVRYEYEAPPSEANNQLGNFSPTAGLEQVGKQISSIYNPDYRNVSPRLGIAWDVTGKGTTVVRAGGSIIYDTLTMNMLISEQNTQNAVTLGLNAIPTGATLTGLGTPPTPIPSPGNIQLTTLTLAGSKLNWNGVVFPATNVFACSVASPCSVLGMDQHFRNPYVSTWTVSVQHALTNNLSLEAAYVGNHGTKLPGIIDINQLNPQAPAENNPPTCNHCELNSDRPFYSQFPYLQFINWISNLDHSNYNGLQVTLTQRPVHGLSFLAAYTYSHALDDASENWNQYGVQNSLAPQLEYANSDFDIRHRFTFTLTYAIPGKKSFAHLLEGWQINTIVSLYSSLPWTALDTADDISGTGENNDHWDFFGTPSDFKSGPNPIPYFSGTSNPTCLAKATALGAATVASLNSFGCYMQGRSVLIPPAKGTFGTAGRNMFPDSGFRNWDFSVVKNQKLTERFSAQFRAEFFNILNHPNIANPYGGPSDYGSALTDDPSSTTLFGCGCATPDVAAANPVIGSGSNRAVQLGLKFIF